MGLLVLPLRMISRRWLERVDELAFAARVAAEDARSRLLHHLSDERHHLIKFVTQPLGADRLLSIRESYGDTLSDGEMLLLLQEYNTTGRVSCVGRNSAVAAWI